MTTIDIKHHLDLLELELERVEARQTVLRDDPVYMADLELEIAATRHAFVSSVVLEIALLRAELDRPLQG